MVPIEELGAGIIVFLMFSLVPFVFGILATAFLGGPYLSWQQKAVTVLAFLAMQVVWNLWLYFGGGFEFFYYD